MKKVVYACIHVLQMFYWPLLLQDPSSRVSLVLSGDFNSCPEFGVYKLVTEGFLPSSCEDWNSSKGSFFLYIKIM